MRPPGPLPVMPSISRSCCWASFLAMGEILTLPWYQQRVFYLAKAGENMPEDVADWEIVRETWEASDKEQDKAGAG